MVNINRSLAATPLLVWLALAGCRESQAERSSTTLVVSVTDGVGGDNVSARMLLFDETGEALRLGQYDMYEIRQSRGYCDLAHGAIGTVAGIALAYGSAEIPINGYQCPSGVGIPYGEYRVWVWRGMEYEIFETTVTLDPGLDKVYLEAPLTRAWVPTGTLAADLHVHAQGSNDSLVPNWVRAITQSAAGIQVIGATEHNANTDFSEGIEEAMLADRVVSLPGNELSPPQAHIGLYPVQIEPDRPGGGAPAQEDLNDLGVGQVLELANAQPGGPFVQVNHPRFSAGLFDWAGWNGDSWPPPFPTDFDGVEVLAGFTAFNDPDNPSLDRLVRDFYTLTAHGVLVTALGNSDTHHLNWVLDGVARTYVYVDQPTVRPFDEVGFMDALRSRRAVATTGPWLDVQVEGVGPGEVASAEAGLVYISIELRQAGFVHTQQIRVMSGGEVALVLPVPDDVRQFSWDGTLPVAQDTWIGVDASGDTPLPVELTGSYHIDKGHEGTLPFALINPILVDADGDGQVSFGQ